MGLTSTLYRFQIELSDLDRSLYQTLEFRAALHPSESLPFFTTRILAYCLNVREGLEFTAGISAPEDPAIRIVGPTGNLELWVDIGNPTAKRVHKASKSSGKILLYTYKDASRLAKDLKAEQVHQVEKIGLYSLEPKFLNDLGSRLERDNRWEMTHQDGELYIGIGNDSFQGKVTRHLLSQD